LRRLAEGADEGAAHPLRVAKAGYFRDAFDRLAGRLHALPSKSGTGNASKVSRTPPDRDAAAPIATSGNATMMPTTGTGVAVAA